MRKKSLEKVFISEADQYLFAQGTHYDIYKKLGAHPSEEDGVKGTYFAVWAPNAAYVNVVGNFNSWNEFATPLTDREQLLLPQTFPLLHGLMMNG